MARDADAIEKEIEQARNALATSLDELSERASPQRLSEQGKEMAAAKWADPRIKYAVYAVGGILALAILRKLFT